MSIGRFINSILSISIIFSSCMVIIAIPYVSSQEDINNSQAMQLEQEINQLSPDHQKMILPFLQQEAQKGIMEASPEELELIIQRSQQNLREASPEAQELIIQQMKQMFPPQLVEKLLPAELK
ncbi:MAG TPA: hypothetical protein VJ697_08410 [Nitrososphaeraceae archaeon]|nr:hypothetical protein [Nitrososphaeraceae archaeon]